MAMAGEGTETRVLWGWAHFGGDLGGSEHWGGGFPKMDPMGLEEEEEDEEEEDDDEEEALRTCLMPEHAPRSPSRSPDAWVPPLRGSHVTWGGSGPPPLSVGDIPGVPKSPHLGLASSSMALRSCGGTEEGWWGLVPLFVTPLSPPMPPCHLHPADGSHQLPGPGDEDALQLQHLEEVMGLGEVTMGTHGDRATPTTSPG